VNPSDEFRERVARAIAARLREPLKLASIPNRPIFPPFLDAADAAIEAILGTFSGPTDEGEIVETFSPWAWQARIEAASVAFAERTDERRDLTAARRYAIETAALAFAAIESLDREHPEVADAMRKDEATRANV
jgi:hypothetical protein